MRYYVDYLDFCLGGIANRRVMSNKILRLKYDVLCINPYNDIFVFTISETLLEDSNRILIEYDDFWKSGIFKIAFSKKYNFELAIYNSEVTDRFFDQYLVGKLNLKGKNTYIIHRTSDADVNNRALFRKRIHDLDAMHQRFGEIMNYSMLDSLITDLSDRSNDKSQIFQRGYIVRDMFLKYPMLYKKNTFLYNMFDQNYNDAMAISVDATRLSAMKHRISGVVLGKFIFNMDSQMYKKINEMSPHQIYLLVNNPSWRAFVNDIDRLYVFLWNLNKIPNDYNIYNYFKKRVDLITYSYKNLIRIMDRIVDLVTVPEPLWQSTYEQFKYEFEKIVEMYLQQTNYIIWIASEIFKKREYINMMIDDILKEEKEYGCGL